MTKPRSKVVDPNLTKWYHCISRCARQAFLMKDPDEQAKDSPNRDRIDRKQWVQDRLQLVAESYAISVGAFSILDNHFHFLLKLEPERANSWTPEEVVRRWAKLHPPRKKGKRMEVTEDWVNEQVKNAEIVATWRHRLSNLGWFMKDVKEPFSRLANKEDGCAGAFFEGRYKSIAVLDEAALVSTMAYIDLNPFAAGVEATPESCVHTSLHVRLKNVADCDRMENLAAAEHGSIAARAVSDGLEDSCWLMPIENTCKHDRRQGIVEDFTLGNYLLLIDYSSRRERDGKASLAQEVKPIFERLRVKSDVWENTLESLLGRALRGTYFATESARLSEVAKHFAVHHCNNLNGCQSA